MLDCSILFVILKDITDPPKKKKILKDIIFLNIFLTKMNEKIEP